MKKTFHLLPRGFGKTARAVHKLKVGVPEAVLIVTTMQEALRVRREFKLDASEYLHISSAEHFSSDFMRGKPRPKTVILDEYLSFPLLDTHWQYFYESISTFLNPKELIIYSSYQIPYDQYSLRHVVEDSKRMGLSYGALLEKLAYINPALTSSVHFKRELARMYYNFLTDPDTEVVTNGWL